MNVEDTSGLNSQEPTITRVYKLHKLDGEVEKITFAGPKELFRTVVVKYAEWWCPTGFKIDHRSRTIEALEVPISVKAEITSIKLTTSHIREVLEKHRSGTVVFTTTSGRNYGVRIIASRYRNKQMYKLLYDAERVGPEFTYSSSKLLKLAAIISALRGLAYTEKTYYI